MSAGVPPSNLLLNALNREDFSILRPSLSQVRLVVHSELQLAGAPVEQVYFPLSGMISLQTAFQTGEAIEVAAIGCEGAVGARTELQPRVALYKAIVQLPGLALRIDIESFQRAAAQSIAITRLATCANDIQSANAQQSAGCNAIHGLEARLARWLLHARDRHDSEVLPLTHDVLSQMLGVRRSTVSLAVEALQRAGAIEYQRGQIKMHDRERLEASSCECYRELKRNVGAIVQCAKLASQALPAAV